MSELNNNMRQLKERVERLEGNLKDSNKSLWMYFIFLSMLVFGLLIVVMTGR